MSSKDTALKRQLGKRVDAAVLAAGYGSADEFARGIGLPRSTFFKLRKGTLDPRFSTLMKIAKGLGVTLSALVGDERGPTKSLQPSTPPSVPIPPGKKPRIKMTLTILAEDPPQWLSQALENIETKSHPHRPIQSQKPLMHSPQNSNQ
jgi:transcriptional regulator with XRE-family HTH domain